MQWTSFFPRSKKCFILVVFITSALLLIPFFVSSGYRRRSVSPFLLIDCFRPPASDDHSPTNLSHLGFGLLGSDKAWHHRKAYIESWWRPNSTRGFLYLDRAPTGDLLPWSPSSPPYKVSGDLTVFFKETKAVAPIMIRMVLGILEAFRDTNGGNLRWLVMGDDDSVFFVDNMVDVLRRYDHRKYYYIGGQSEYVWSNFWYSFNQGFGGAGFILSYPVAKALAGGMESCLRRYASLNSADLITMACVSDIGVVLSPEKGIHQIDLRGDLSGFLSSHPKYPLLSLHHLDMVDPLFPGKNRSESMDHLMMAALVDQARMLQMTVCHHRMKNWTFSVSWGYSAQIYERIMPRSYLQNPIETFKTWTTPPSRGPNYMFNTRLPSNDPCEAPHMFFLERIQRNRSQILTTYRRSAPRGLQPCASSGGHAADYISEIHVVSSSRSRKQMDRCECCDVERINGGEGEIKYRECKVDEIIA